MTLDTRVYVHDQVDVHELFREAQRLLGEADEDKRGPDQQQWKDGQDRTWADGAWSVRPDSPWTIMNECGQGLPAWLMVHYRPDAALRTPEQAAEHDEDCNLPSSDYYDPDEPPCEGTGHQPPCWVEVSMDTAYGYRGPDGMGCGDLHALLVAALGEWLDARGAAWSWRNEFTNEVHGGEDRYPRLVDLLSGGFEAAAWFTTTVQPALQAHVERGSL